MLFLDLNRFKTVNDSLGHQAGDILLKEVSRRLKSCARPQDTLARLGGDEFALLIEDSGDLSVPVDIAERILESLRSPVRIGRQKVFASCSIGIVQSSERASYPEAIIRDADVAMYAAKKSGFGEYAGFDKSMVAEATAVLSLQTDLQTALERAEFELAYQLIVDPETSVIKGFEALIRWRHPMRGLLSPRLVRAGGRRKGHHPPDRPLGDDHRLRPALRMEARFGAYDLNMCVNTSASEFDDPGFVEELTATLERFHLPPRALELEITESIFLNPDRGFQALSAKSAPMASASGRTISERAIRP